MTQAAGGVKPQRRSWGSLVEALTFHRLQWFLPIAVTIHNLEEAFTYCAFLIEQFE